MMLTRLCLCALIGAVDAQIRVVTPQWLVEQVPGGHGKISGATATFGAPFYGDDVLGRLVYGESKGENHCTDADYELPVPETELRGSSEAVKMINIALIRRGKCSFVTKVQVAMAKGAHAVIIVDTEDSALTSSDLQKVIVADDGYGENIHVPSILISKQEGQLFIDAAKKSSVVVELSWEVPAEHIVGMDLWMSSGNTDSMQFLKDFSKNRKVLNEVMKFRPHYSVFSMPASDPAVYQELCSDTTGQYCAEDPDASGFVTGKMVLDEDVRQLCIHELTKIKQEDYAANAVDYAAKFWDYVERLLDTCPFTGEVPEKRFGPECSRQLMHAVGLDVEAVMQCVAETRNEKLREQRDNTAWSPRALRINGWRYTGMMDADLVTRAVCSGFVDKPVECERIIAPRDPFAKFKGFQPGVSVREFLFGLSAVGCFAFVAMFLARRALKANLEKSVREEVMLEVQSQMQEYSKLSGH